MRRRPDGRNRRVETLLRASSRSSGSSRSRANASDL
jgi:hypothetical protein